MRPLKLNSHGDDVAKWQRFLLDAGYKPGAADGHFGPATHTATVAFQKKRGLTADGVVGNATFGKAMTLDFKPLPEHDEAPADPSTSVVATIASVKVNKLGDGRALFFTAGMAIDADGAYRAYHPGNKGLDYLANAGGPGNWYGVVTDKRGQPIVQGPNDPAPGFHVSATSLQDATFGPNDPRRYVDSESVPYIVLPGGKLGGARLGDFGLIINLNNKVQAAVIVADSGPKAKIGEASIAAAAAVLGPGKGSPKNGGTEKKIIRYIVFPGSGDGKAKSVDVIAARVDGLLHALSKEQVIAVCT